MTALVLWFAAPAAAAYPPAGYNAFDSMGSFRVSSQLLSIPETPVVAVGPTLIWHGDAYNPGDGLFEIDTRIEQMTLFSSTPIGNVTVKVIPPAPGKIKQKEPGVDFPANSWFDVRVEVQISGPFGNFRLFSNPATPIRLMAMIDAIPPFDSQYVPEGTFAGVDLLNESGQVVGFISHVGHFVGQHPTFSVAPEGPSTYDPADLFGRPTAPRMRASGLGLAVGDDVDGISYGLDFIFTRLMDVRFSVDENSRGRVGSAVRREADKTPNEAHGDEFRVTPFAVLGGGSNAQVLDETGDTAPPFPLLVSDDVDALTEQPPEFGDADGNGVPDRPIYFTLSSGSPSLATLNARPADILVTTPGGPPRIYIPHSNLGLTPDDDIDAFCLSDSTNLILYSLAPGSVSLAGRSPADTFLFPGQPVTAPTRWATAANLGLEATDNVNALKCHVGEIDEFVLSSLEFRLHHGEGSEDVSLVCRSGWHAGTDGRTGRGEGQRVWLYQTSLYCDGEFSGGPISTRLRASSEFPNMLSYGQICDNTDDGLLGIEPWGNGMAEVELLAHLNFTIGAAVNLHSATGFPFSGVITRKPPKPGEFLRSAISGSTPSPLGDGPPRVEQAAGPIPLFLEGGVPTPFSVSDLTYTPDARPKPVFTPEGFVDAAAGSAPPSPGGLAALYGVYDTGLVEAATIPLPRVLGNTVQVRFLVDGPAQAASSKGRKDQAAQIEIPAPLLFVSSTQINLQIPWEVDANAGTVTAIVSVNGVDSDPVELPIAPVSPGFFTADFGPGRAVAINPDGSLAQPVGSLGNSRPAVPGETLLLLATGLGATSPAGVTGANSYDLDGNFVQRDTVLPTVRIGGIEAPVVFSGLSPEFVGVFQVNATVPNGVAAGSQAPLTISIGGLTSRNDVTIAVGTP